MKTKSVGYFYPTSPLAESSGFKQGGYRVEVAAPFVARRPRPQITCFATLNEALAYAHTLPEPFDRYSLCGHEDACFGRMWRGVCPTCNGALA